VRTDNLLAVKTGGKCAIETGGILDVETGGLFKIAGVTVTATAAQLNAVASGTGTSNETWTVGDGTGAKIALNANAATGAFTLSLVPTNLTGTRTITFPDATGTVALTSSLNLTAGADGTAGTLTVWPATATNGKIVLSALDSGAAANILTIRNEAIGQATTIEIPDPGVAAAQFVTTNSDHTVLVDAGGADRRVTLSGDVTFTGAFSPVFAIPSSSTWTFPSGGGALLTEPTGLATTTASTFTVDSDSVTGKLTVSVTGGGTNNTITLATPTTTADRVITLPDVTGTLASLAGTQTFTGGKTFTGTVDFQGAVGASAGNPTINLSGSSGAFTTPTGTNTLSGDVVISGSKTFTTGTGAIGLNGNITSAAAKSISLGTAAGGPTTGQIQLFSATAAKGELRLKQPDDANNKITTIQANNAAANATITLPNATATLATVGLAETLDLKTLTSAGNIAQTGATTITSGTTGIIIPDTNTAGLSIHAANAKGSIRIKAADSAGDTITDITNASQADARTYTIPDCGAAAGQFVLTNAAQKCIIATGAADRTITLTGDLTRVGAHALTLTTTGVTAVTLPTTGTLATRDGSETLTNKSISGDANTITLLGPSTPKALTIGVRGGATPVAGMGFILNFDMDNTAGTVTWTNDTGRTVKVLQCRGIKTDNASAAADTVKVSTTAGDVTDAKSLNGMADKTIFEFTTQDDAMTTVTNGQTISVTTVLTANCQCEITVLCVFLN
jgi:hypothetical protein